MLRALLAQESLAQFGPFWFLVAQGGMLGAITTIFGMLHRSAVNAYREMANVHREIAAVERQRADTAHSQMMQLLVPIRQAGEP